MVGLLARVGLNMNREVQNHLLPSHTFSMTSLKFKSYGKIQFRKVALCAKYVLNRLRNLKEAQNTTFFSLAEYIKIKKLARCKT